MIVGKTVWIAKIFHINDISLDDLVQRQLGIIV